MTTEQLNDFIKAALHEDIREGDHSTLSSIDASAQGKAILKVKEAGIIAGLEIAEKIFKVVEPNCTIVFHKKDGDDIVIGDIAFEVSALVHTILQCERLVLNIMQRMSGIASLTHLYKSKIKAYGTILLDTRKTTPLFRWFEKEGVRIGGGQNHRFGLYDMIMLKDNHIDYCGSIEKAIDKANAYIKTHQLKIKIEVETRSLDDVHRVMTHGGVDRIMLDNFTPELLKEAVHMIGKKYETEASGGINLDTIEAYAATGVQYISCGAIIHHAHSMDLSLKAIKA
jgi:nicotinate-nucleotide pyrophosphorylase (carboxylating)